MRRGWDRGYVLKGRGQLILIVCMVYSLPLQESSTWAEKEVAFISPMDQQRSVAWRLTGSANVLALSLFPPLFTFLPPPLPSPLLSYLSSPFLSLLSYPLTPSSFSSSSLLFLPSPSFLLLSLSPLSPSSLSTLCPPHSSHSLSSDDDEDFERQREFPTGSSDDQDRDHLSKRAAAYIATASTHSDEAKQHQHELDKMEIDAMS